MNKELYTRRFVVGALLRRGFRRALEEGKLSGMMENKDFVLEYYEDRGLLDSMFIVTSHYYIHEILQDWVEEVNNA